MNGIFKFLILIYFLFIFFCPCFASPISLEQKIGSMILIGFSGTKPTDSAVQKISEQIKNGHIRGVIFYSYNVENPQQVQQLTGYLKSTRVPFPFIIALDQEGGRVQRLTSKKGFKDFLSAYQVSQRFTPTQAFSYYQELGNMIHENGFNLNFAPVVDVDYVLPCPVIGELERSYSSTPDIVVQYARAMIHAQNQAGILSCIKHFPGHGSIQVDTHEGLGDGTQSWHEYELLPYYEILKEKNGTMVMTAHIMNKKFDQKNPATLSPKMIKLLLREKAHYQGVVISDDLHMGAILKNYGLEEAVIKAINAGVDILIFSNNPLAAKGVENFAPDPELPEKVIQIVLSAIEKGRITKAQIEESFIRINQSMMLVKQ